MSLVIMVDVTGEGRLAGLEPGKRAKRWEVEYEIL